MILPFSTHWPAKMGELAGKENYFPEKIWRGLEQSIGLNGIDWHEYYHIYKNMGVFGWDIPVEPEDFLLRPKIHTLRHDLHNRWQPGKDIHFTINNRTKNSFRFAPVVKCTAVQYVLIEYIYDGLPVVLLGNSPDRLTEIFGFNHDYMAWYGEDHMLELAQNDGFDSIDHFFRYFNESCQLKLIQWTDKRY